MQYHAIQINTNGLRRTLSHISSLTHGKKRKHLRNPDKECLKKNVASTSVMQQPQNPPIYGMPFSMDHTNKEQPLEKVSTIKTFLQSCVKLLNDPSFVKVLQDMLEICNIEVEGKLE
jgi:hypothetical protein